MYKKFLAIFLAVLALVDSSYKGVSAIGKETSALGTFVKEINGLAGDADYSYDSPLQMMEDMELVCDNELYEFYYCHKNMSVALKNKLTGDIFTSNPYDASLDPLCTGNVKKNLESQLIISYYDTDYKKYNMWSSSDCLKYGQYSAELYDNGVALNLSIGEDKSKLLVPIAIFASDFDEYIKNLSNNQVRKLNAFYTYYAAGDFGNEELLSSYPLLKKHDLYILEIEPSDNEKKDISEILNAAGCTENKIQTDMKKLGVKIEETKFPNFNFTLEYVLEKDRLDVNIKNSSIKYSDDYQLLEITVLPYFGCDKPQAEGKGYLIIPDGSGALIDINNQSDIRETAIAGRVYGENPVIGDIENLPDGKTYHLPVFGVVRNDGSAFTAITTSGDIADNIVALLGGNNGQYYTVYNRFLYTEYESVVIGQKADTLRGKSTIFLSDKNHYTTDYSISYYFLSGDNANYVGMANIYKNYLFKNYSEKKKHNEQILIKTIGAALVEKKFLGFMYDSEKEFTTYDDCVSILTDLKEKGINKPFLSMMGWEKHGLDSSISNKLRFSSKQGGKFDFKNLLKYCNDNDISLALNNEFVFTKYNRWFDGFTVKSAASQTLNFTTMLFPEYRTFEELDSKTRYIVSPKKYQDYITSLETSSKQNNVTNLGINSLGKYLVADFSKKHSINRQQTLATIQESLSNLNKDIDLTFDGANAYVLPYAKGVQDVPCYASGRAGETESVPFLQLVLNSRINLYSDPVNLADNSNSKLLDCVRCGLIPSYVVGFRNIEYLKKSDYSHYFAINYKYILNDIVTDYTNYSTAFDVVQNNVLISSYKISDNVYCSNYSDGIAIYTNYNPFEYNDGDITVPANSYFVSK